MSNKYESENARGRDDSELRRYAAYQDGDSVVVYDTRKADAWVRSDAAVDVTERT